MSEEMDILDHMIESIQSGTYEPDDKLPSENEFAERFKVPRMTVRKAYLRLQELGYAYSMQGKGNFVKDRHQRIPLALSSRESFSRKMKDLGFDYESRNLFCDQIETNNKIYEALGAEEGGRVFRVGRLRLIDKQPIALHISYVSESLFPDIGTVGREITSMYEFYESRGYHTFRYTQSLLSVTFPSKYERELFACAGVNPLLVLESEHIDDVSGNTLEYSKIMYRGDFFTYVV
ncbi:GntR family transcriptional regulator [Cohnella faecalis]|uniref:GntR family transcriptional regulator n=1 Tax=Cohnella faecalis TaxID=2315694 RepID=UPI0036071BDB